MTLDEIVLQARDFLDDEVEPFLYSTDRLYSYADEALGEFCLRTRCLVDSTTEEVCEIALVAGQAIYPLHPAVVVVRRVEFHPIDTTQRPDLLRRTTSSQLDHENPRWSSQTGRPCSVVQDLQSRTLRLSHIPDASALGTLRLTAWRKPLDDERLEAGGDEPIIDEHFHRSLAHWICYRAFQRKDGEKNDDARAQQHLERFEQVAGPRPTAAQLRALATDDAGEVRPHWF